MIDRTMSLSVCAECVPNESTHAHISHTALHRLDEKIVHLLMYMCLGLHVGQCVARELMSSDGSALAYSSP